MTIKRLFLAVALVGVLAGTAFLAKEVEGSGSRMATAAERFLAGLEPEQKKKATFAFEDKERLRWWFTPQQAKRLPLRKGVPLSDLTPKQRELALELLKTGAGEAGFKQAKTIMSLESLLAELEKMGAMVREPGWYFISVFGEPGKTGKWGWRWEGHHLSMNFTIHDGKVVSATPMIFGANPAEVKAGKEKGLRTLADAETRFRDLLASLDADLKAVAKQPNLLPEIKENEAKPSVGAPVGLAASKMNEKQRGALWKLIESYANRMPADVAAMELAAVKSAGLDNVHFAYGGAEGTPGEKYTYRVQGPTFLIEFLNEQSDSAGNKANHIHSGWRNMKGDFGLTAP